MKQIDKHGINFKITRSFILFALFIIAILWLVQVAMFSIFYQSMKVTYATLYGRQIVEEYTAEDRDDSKIEAMLRETDSIFYVLDVNGNLIYSFNRIDIGALQRIDRESAKHFIAKVDEAYENVSHTYQGLPYFIGTTVNSEHKIDGLVYGERAEINDVSIYFYMHTSLGKNDGTVQILTGQLIIVSVLILLLATVTAFFISKTLSDPIVALNKAAGSFSAGNRIRFDEKGYTEVKQLAETLNNSNEELLRADEFRRDLVANITHDLRTPLTIIRGNAELVRDLTGDNAEKREQQLNVIIDETDRLTLLVSDVLELSKMQAGIVEIAYTDVNISDLIRNVVNSFSVLEQTNSYRFSCKIEDGIIVKSDSRRLEQVMYNLLGNAVNYAGEDKEIIVNCTATETAVRVEIKDHGDGIAESEMKDIWNKYYRSNKTKREKVGTGLGLSIVKTILESLSYKYGVDSTVGEGTTFWFEINK